MKLDRSDYVFVSGLTLHKANWPIHVKQADVYWDMNYHGFWMHRETHKRFLVDLALRGCDFSEFNPPKDYEPDW